MVALAAAAALLSAIEPIMTLTSFFQTTKSYMHFYSDFVVNWWAHITFWQYVTLMVLCLVAGYALMRGDAGRRR